MLSLHLSPAPHSLPPQRFLQTSLCSLSLGRASSRDLQSKLLMGQCSVFMQPLVLGAPEEAERLWGLPATERKVAHPVSWAVGSGNEPVACGAVI